MYEVDQHIIEEAVKCDRKFECLKEGCCPSCNIQEGTHPKVMFLTKNERFCNYNLRFGGSDVCRCPVRKEIHRKYKE